MFSANTSQVSEDRLYVEDVFSTYLYTGNGGTQTITNGIDLAGKGGLVWIKARSSAQNNVLADTANGTSLWLSSNTTDGQSGGSVVTAFSSTGFNTGGNTNYVAGNGVTYASWTFRKAPKFFDVVTYTGTGSTQRIAHSLGVTPGVIIIKRTSDVAGWRVWHRSYSSPATDALDLNTTSAVYNGDVYWGNAGVGATPDATTFSVGTNASTNASGSTYVAYLFAHDTTSDGIIQCGSYSGSGSAGNTVTLGWEPQWVMLKASTTTQGWWMYDNMRGMPVGSNDAALSANTSSAEQSYEAIQPTATGFQLMNGNPDTNASGNTYIYIAIRRGPMRTPTSGTSVFYPYTASNSSYPGTLVATTGFPCDLTVMASRTRANWPQNYWADKLRGATSSSTAYIRSDGINAELSYSGSTVSMQSNTSVTSYGWGGGTGEIDILWNFARAPSFMDIVCYTGSSGLQTVTHNLGVAPELVIIKSRNGSGDWYALYTAGSGQLVYLNLDISTSGSNPAANFSSGSGYTPPSATTLFLNNFSSNTHVAYLFASCPGVSKVGSYTGNGSSQTINCGFAAGARFVMIKRTDSTGDWYVWDTARGIVAGDDPHLSLNTTAAEVTTDDSVDTDSSGFVVNQLSATNINVSSATYIYLAVA